MATIGVISDTHGLLRPEVRAHLAQCDRIIHAGDLDDRETLQRVSLFKDVTIVRGNCDRGAWAQNLRDFELLTVEGQTICVVHALDALTLDLQDAGISAVVFGHTHVPHNELRGGILYFNPGSAGPARHGKPIALGKLHVDERGIRGEIVAFSAPGLAPVR
jgi:putative phosphoesterase